MSPDWYGYVLTALAGIFAPLLTLETALALAALLAVIWLTLALRPRVYYFVRHGETEANRDHIKQGAEGALSEKGRAQAARVGAALKGLGISRIFSSTYPRAIETANIIRQSVHAHITPTRLLVERKNPSQVLGKSTHDPEVERIVNLTDLAYHEDDYRFSDEENFLDQRRRARHCLAYLARHGTPVSCVVTHHAFLKMLIASMLYPRELHSADFVKLSFFNYSTNAGITVCEWNPWRMFSKTRGWRVLLWDALPEN